MSGHEPEVAPTTITRVIQSKKRSCVCMCHPPSAVAGKSSGTALAKSAHRRMRDATSALVVVGYTHPSTYGNLGYISQEDVSGFVTSSTVND